jgi:hypothetical protein
VRPLLGAFAYTLHMDEMIVLGVGELGRLFAGAALAEGLHVTPITRGVTPAHVLAGRPPHVPILVAVGEDALERALDSLPAARRDDAVLVQNELWPSVWQSRGFRPSLMLPWVLQKPGLPRTVVGTTPVFGAHAAMLGALCARLSLPCVGITEREVPQALADKYTFILVINALGCWRDELLGRFLTDAQPQIAALCQEASALSAALLDAPLDPVRSHRLTLDAMEAMASMRARGRTASLRVDRALGHAATHGLNVPALRACRAA